MINRRHSRRNTEILTYKLYRRIPKNLLALILPHNNKRHRLYSTNVHKAYIALYASKVKIFSFPIDSDNSSIL